jgi:hypothetical protein
VVTVRGAMGVPAPAPADGVPVSVMGTPAPGVALPMAGSAASRLPLLSVPGEAGSWSKNTRPLMKPRLSGKSLSIDPSAGRAVMSIWLARGVLPAVPGSGLRSAWPSGCCWQMTKLPPIGTPVKV